MIDPKEFSSSKTKRVYPYLRLLDPVETLPLVIKHLELGEMPLTIIYEGSERVVARISKSPYNISKILRCCGAMKYFKSEEESADVTSVLEYMEVL